MNQRTARIQKALNLPVTGVYDIVTTNAVKQWQLDNHLVSDGVVGDKTWNALVIASEQKQFDLVDISKVPFDISGLKHQLPIEVYQKLPEFISNFNLVKSDQLALFLGQCSHESTEFTVLEENLGYSAAGLLKTFPKKFISLDHAKKYEHQPIKIANYVYANVNGNGDEFSGDGWKFRGQGYIQLTGKANFKAISLLMGVDLVQNPEKVISQYPLMTSGYFFTMRKIWNLTELPLTEETIMKITKLINPAFLGLKERTIATKQFSTCMKG